MSQIEICQCKGCELPILALGMCNKHWRRNRKYGSPFVTKYHVLRGMPADQRFARLHKKGEHGCWEWIGNLDKDGYGLFNAHFNGAHYKRAHRFSWAFYNLKEIPKGMFVCHSCDNPCCVNPAHLWLGSCEQNHADMDRKGRRFNARGEKHVTAKLTEDQVRQILADGRPYSEIAADFKVAMPTISSIKNRVSWAHVEADSIPRNKRGSGSGNRGKSKLITPEIVREIRSSEQKGKELAVRFGVSEQLVSAIKTRRLWTHLEN